MIFIYLVKSDNFFVPIFYMAKILILTDEQCGNDFYFNS